MTNENLKSFINENNLKFVSFKYLTTKNSKVIFNYIDIAAKNLKFTDEHIIINNIKLNPIDGKFFIDPFRSLSTLFCLCEEAVIGGSQREFIINGFKEPAELQLEFLECDISFTIKERSKFEDKTTSIGVNHDNTLLLSNLEPYDKSANLRSEILDILEDINISTNFHYHSSTNDNCIISIKATTLLDLVDNFLISQYIITNVAASYGKEAIIIDNFIKPNNRKIKI